MLRDYQEEMKARLLSAWERHRSVMVQMPTGTGKTHLLASVVGDFVSGGAGVVWIVAHRRELVAQIGDTLARYGIGRADGRVRVFSIQWLSRHWEGAGEGPALIVVDEAHHALAASYAALWRRYPSARKLGVTATPCRLDRKGFTALFEELVTSWSVAEFIRQGVLSAFDYVSIRPGSEEQRLVDSLQKRGADGDYQVKEMDAVLNRPPGIGRLYRSVARFAPGRKGMVYAVSIAHARNIADFYTSQGLKAVAIDSRTPAAERKRLLESFRRGDVRVLVNVDVFSEGFDCPDVEFVQLARPTLSLAKYLQQVGRGLRKSDGKASCVLMDHVGLYRVFGLPTRRWDWEALFRGRLAGKAVAGNAVAGRMGCEASPVVAPVVGAWPGSGSNGGDCGELVVVMDHGSLLSSLSREVSAECVVYTDPASGLQGIARGGQTVVAARFTMVKFLDDDLLWGACGGGQVCYVDLRNGCRYAVRPQVVRCGGIGLLQVGRTYHSRTRQPYVNTCGLPPSAIVQMGFYVKMYDRRMSPECRLLEYGGRRSEPHACLLEGDEECAYCLSGELPDGSIVVMDGEGRYFHVEPGGAKRYVASNRPSTPDENFDTAVSRLLVRARVRVDERRREQAHLLAAKRRRLLEQGADAVPYQVGSKWGLQAAGRVLLPPVYRRLLPPVGVYCAFQDSSCQWGVVAVDGRVVVPARYMGVEIAPGGTARLTLVPGKVETVELAEYDEKKW